MSIVSIGVNTLPRAYEAQLKNQQNVNFQAKATNTLERTPKKDTVEKKGMSTGGKIALGAVAITGATALIDAVACKGKHIKNIYTTIKAKTTKSGNTKNFKQMFNDDVRMLDNIRKEQYSYKGKTVQESINNFFGKKNKITAHTYDLSQEYPAIVIQRNHGGYTDLIITPKGFVDRRHRGVELPRFVLNANSHHVTNNRICDLKVPERRCIVKCSVEDPIGGELGTRIRMSLLSPNNKLTPAQKDFEKIMNNPELSKKFTEYLDEMARFMNRIDKKTHMPTWNSREQIHKNFQKFDPADYDTFLSVIQSLAKLC